MSDDNGGAPEAPKIGPGAISRMVASLAMIEAASTRTISTLNAQMQLAAMTGHEGFEELFDMVEAKRKETESNG